VGAVGTTLANTGLSVMLVLAAVATLFAGAFLTWKRATA
jgi:hypothetical protein